MIFLSLIFSVFALALDSQWLNCDYAFYSMPTTSVSLEIFPDGTTADHVKVSIQGRTHLESFTAEERSPEMYLHGWISKENPDNAIEMIVYREKKPQGSSKLVNHKMPFGKDMWGNCNFPEGL